MTQKQIYALVGVLVTLMLLGGVFMIWLLIKVLL
jgi:hypothetical protein